MKIKNAFLIAALLLTTSVATASDKRIQMNFAHLEDRAEEVVDVTLDGQLLKMAGAFLDNDDPEEKQIRGAVTGLTGIYVKSYSFKEAGSYSSSDIEGVRRQLGNGWQKIVNVRSKKSDNVEIYVMPSGNNAAGMVIIAAEPLEFTVVQITGVIDMQKLGSLDGQLGIPDLDIQVSKK